MPLGEYRQLALSLCVPACPRLFRARQEAFLFSVDASFLPEGWGWPEGGIFTAQKARHGFLLRLSDAYLSSLPVPALSFNGWNGTAGRELLRLFALHPGGMNGQNAFFYYSLLKAAEEKQVEKVYARLLPRAAECMRQHIPLPSFAGVLLCGGKEA